VNAAVGGEGEKDGTGDTKVDEEALRDT